MSVEDLDPSARTSSPNEEKASADKLFKTAFALFLGNLVELVRPRLAARLDLDHARFLAPEQLPDFRKAGHVLPDLVAETQTLSGEPQVVVVHVEAEGRFGKAMDDRMAEYGLHLFLSTKKTVVSIAVFLSGGKAGVTVREVVAEVDEEDGGTWQALRFRYLAFGLGPSLAESYVDLPQPLAPALAALMRPKAWGRVEHKLECMRAIGRQAKDLDVSRQYVLGRIVNKYLKLDGEDEQRFADELGRERNKEIHAMNVIWEEALTERETRGEARGQLTTARKAILLLARSYSWEVSADFEKKLDAIHDLDRLYEALEHMPRVRSVEELNLD